MKLTQLKSVTKTIPISLLTEEQLRELQIALGRLGYPVGEIDGLLEPKTRNA
jgi:peptidoglycan hydrolase-like protein with peptidoglycan-binding domain